MRSKSQRDVAVVAGLISSVADVCEGVELGICTKYTLDGYDNNIWQNVSWWILLVLTNIPYFGFHAVFYFFPFLMIDRSDEF
jgi:hypothetical protein